MISRVQGLKYPDEYIIKYFFKQGLHTLSSLKFIEFGCSNGNNLTLPYQYNHSVIGVDICKTAIAQAKQNFALFESSAESHFFCQDMRDFVLQQKGIIADVFLLPNIACYISREEFIELLEKVKKNQLIKKNADFFIRLRTPKDYRFGLGKQVAHNTFIMPADVVTGEPGALLTFYESWELISLLEKHIGLTDFQLMHLDCQNPQGGQVILNSDLVIWGKVNN